MKQAERETPPSRYLRQSLLAQIGAGGQRRIQDGKITVVGLGALGCVQAAYLARAGVGSIRLVDRDVVEEGNLQRQLLFDESDAREGTPKAEAARRHLERANHSIALESVVAHLDPANAPELLAGSDVILDGTDNFDTRFLLNDFSIDNQIPWIYGACVGTQGIVAPIIPGRTACLSCLVSAGSPAIDPTCESAGILGTVAGIIGSLQAGAALRILVEEAWHPWGPVQVEAWDGVPRALPRTRPDPQCSACIGRDLEFLGGRRTGALEVMCGADAVQLLPVRRAPRDLAAAERALGGICEVRRTPFLVRAEVQGHTLSIFPDGRVIVFGTRDPLWARSLVDRYLAGF